MLLEPAIHLVMAIQEFLQLILQIVAISSILTRTQVSATFNRSSFPADFVFGTGSSSYQFEGAATEGGKGRSIWDTYTHKYPERTLDRSNGDVANDFYHRYKEDVETMKQMGMDAFRFSISWSRVLPRGDLSGGVNKKGIEFYNNLINELLSKGLRPFVALFHWDLPQALEDKYGGFLSPQIVDDFQDYAELCYKEFGDRVKYWITINEPPAYSIGGYEYGIIAPGRCSKWANQACQAGNSSTEPYIVTHNLLLSHAAAVKLYRQKFEATQKGKIGITLLSKWVVPYSHKKADHKAAQRSLDFLLGWILDPLTYGDYPHSMRTLVRARLPNFTEEQSKMIKGSIDFIGLNYYTSLYAANVNVSKAVNASYSTDSHANITAERNGIPIGPPANGSSWLYVYPRGLRDLLFYTKEKYNNPTIYITENGISELDNSTLSLKEALKDPMRIDYHYRHLLTLRKAIQDGVKVEGYFAWSLLDSYEWITGYIVRFGLNFVDYKDGFKRYPKDSAIWFKNFLQK